MTETWLDCWICETMFGRKRATTRHCDRCRRAFCEGEHGSFTAESGSCLHCELKLQESAQITVAPDVVIPKDATDA